MIERFEIQTVTECEIVGAFTLAKAAHVRAAAHADGHEVVYESRECESVGRVFLDGLRADTDYAITLSAGRAAPAKRGARTLPAPRGPVLAQSAVIADTHLSLHHETQHGRLFPESEAILRQTVAEVRRLKPDFVLFPGDITHNGSREEAALAREILDPLDCPLLAVPGDHDMDKGKREIYDAFGPGSWVEHRNGFTIIGCDMIDVGTDRSGFCLGRNGIEHILSALESAEGTVILLCHRQLVPDDYIKSRQRAIADHELFTQEVLPNLPIGTLAYVGHKNVPARHARGNLLQVNVPQPVQYPCGFLRVRRFENGLYHDFVPMFSEVLNDASRVMGTALGADSCAGTYRSGRGHHVLNFVSDPRTGCVRDSASRRAEMLDPLVVKPERSDTPSSST